MPYLFRLADAGDGYLPQPLAGSRTRHRFRLPCDPVSLLYDDRADLAIVSEAEDNPDIACMPLFRYDMVALLANDHPLVVKPCLDAADFASETLITYPVPDGMLDLVKKVLKPAGVKPQRRQQVDHRHLATGC